MKTKTIHIFTIFYNTVLIVEENKDKFEQKTKTFFKDLEKAITILRTKIGDDEKIKQLLRREIFKEDKKYNEDEIPTKLKSHNIDLNEWKLIYNTIYFMYKNSLNSWEPSDSKYVCDMYLLEENVKEILDNERRPDSQYNISTWKVLD